jgi:pimeloyl-ACP methyl ester carboxylesterase
VLFIHGGTIPSAVDYDLGYLNYSWMKRFAAEGFDTFSLDQSGYGFSPRPKMDDPCNMDPSMQGVLIPNPLSAPCSASYPFRLTTSKSDWDEIDTAVDYIRALRGVDKVNLVGWSGGGPRGGGYAYLHPEKVDKLFLYAPGYSADSPTDPPPVLPDPGFPMSLQTRSTLYDLRWDSQVGCVDQFDPRIREYVWPETMSYDLLGQAWGPGPEGLQRTSTASTGWGWNRTTAGQVSAPTAIIVGEFDSLVPSTLQLYQDIGARYRMHIQVPCGSHFLVWEKNHDLLIEAASNWFRTGAIAGQTNGRFIFDRNSELHAVE